MKRTMCILMLISMIAIPAVFSQDSDEPAFVTELVNELRDRGWSEEAVGNIREYAMELNWEGVSVSEPGVVALALELESNEDSDLSGLEKAQLALTLAETATQMEAAGFDERKVAAVTLHSTRNMLSVIEEFKTSDGDSNLGEQIRNEIAFTVRNQLQIETSEKVKNRLKSVGNWLTNYDVPFGEHNFAGLGQ